MTGFVVDTDRSDHPGLAVRGAWAIQVPLVLALERASCDDPGGMLTAIATSARAAVGATGTKRLDDAVKHVESVVDVNIAGFGPLAVEVQRQVDVFNKQAKLLSCAICTGDPDRACFHNPEDDPLIVADPANQALCLRFVTDAFAKLAALAGEYHARIYGEAPPPLRLRLVTRHKTGEAITAKTHFPETDIAGNRTADVSVVLPTVLTEEDLGKLPYFLFHEIFVHGPEEWTAGARRRGTPSRCRLREGFVDAAAAHLLVERLRTDCLHLEAFAGLNAWLADWIEIATLQRAMPGKNIGQEKALALSRQLGRKVFESFEARGRADVAVALAAVLTRIELDEATRVRWLEALAAAALQLGPGLPDVGSPAHRLAVRLHQLATQPRLVADAVHHAFDDYFSADPRKAPVDF